MTNLKIPSDLPDLFKRCNTPATYRYVVVQRLSAFYGVSHVQVWTWLKACGISSPRGSYKRSSR